jgi:hypothetical protein
MSAEQFFAEVVATIESKSIREWATSAHNGPLFLADVETYLAKKGEEASVNAYTVKVVSLAIGMW